jgi:hypothetical protein
MTGNRCVQSLFGILCLALTGCCHSWYSPYDYGYGYGYGSCVDECGYGCYDFDQPLGARRHGHRRGQMMRQPCPCCGRPMPGGMGGFGDCMDGCYGGCFDSCGMGCGSGCGDCFSSCGTCFSDCGTTFSGSCGCGNCGNCGTYSDGQTCQGDWQSSSQYCDCNTGWQEGQSGQSSSPSSHGSQPMAPMSTDEYYVPSEPTPVQSHPQPTEASGAQFLMPQQGNAVQPILWAPPGR